MVDTNILSKLSSGYLMVLLGITSTLLFSLCLFGFFCLTSFTKLAKFISDQSLSMMYQNTGIQNKNKSRYEIPIDFESFM